MTHGAALSSHESPLEAIGPPQQFSPPPGFAPQLTPPHTPHEAAQQVSPLINPRAHVGSAGSGGLMTHGAALSSHESPLEAIGPPQQFSPPPGFAPHETPPHTPHEAAQQVSPLINPNEQVGSGMGVDMGEGVGGVMGEGVGDGVGGVMGDGVGDGVGAGVGGRVMRHGAPVSSHERPLETIGPEQQLELPPGFPPHPVPPHTPHEAAQQIPPETSPRAHVGSAGIGARPKSQLQ